MFLSEGNRPDKPVTASIHVSALEPHDTADAGSFCIRETISHFFQEEFFMEDNRRQPSQPQEEQGYSEVILEPIQDIGIPKPRKGSSAAARRRKKRKQQQRMIIILGSVFAVLLGFFLFMFIRNQQIAAAEAAAQIAAEEADRKSVV
jgi:hypothetical protein